MISPRRMLGSWGATGASVLLLLAAGCPAPEAPEGTTPPDRMDRLCGSRLGGTVGVMPLGNKTDEEVDLAGTEDLIMAAMSDSGCFKVIERQNLDMLINEMKLCSDENPDREYMDCDSFAKKGNLLGLDTMVMGDLIFFDRRVRGTELLTKLPKIGGLEADVEYSALAISLRAANVETGEVDASTVVHAYVHASSGGLDVGVGAVRLRAMVSSQSAMGQALDSMLQRAVLQLHEGLSGTSGGSTPPDPG